MASTTSGSKRASDGNDSSRATSKPRTCEIKKNLIFCFDGTGKDPFDNEIPCNAQPNYDDSTALSNVAKLHLLFGGDFRTDYATKESFYPELGNQMSCYYAGVGTYGTPIRRALNGAFAWQDVEHIIAMALGDLRKLYNEGDTVVVLGFSRGAAIARKFCATLVKTQDLANVQVDLLIALDTVASIGVPDFSSSNRPASDVIFEDNHRVASNVKQAIHCVSIDDKRKHFQPTLMNAEDRVTEVWFAGNHGDVGGGWIQDGLSDVVLRFLLDEIEQRNIGLHVLSPIQVKYQEISDATKQVDIDLDELIIEPDSLGTTHEQSMDIWNPLHYHRELVVIEQDVPTEQLPLIHSSVAERIYGKHYRPVSLRKKPHIVLDNDNDGINDQMKGLAEYLESGARPLKVLKVNESRTVKVHAHKFYNHTGIFLEEGHWYRFAANKEQQWKDGGNMCGADGWERGGIRIFAPSKRFKEANWFALIGAIVEDKDKETKPEMFKIGTVPIGYLAKTSGEFCPFANDAKRCYDNNAGFIEVKVTRLE
jgi:hypothetical protein